MSTLAGQTGFQGTLSKFWDLIDISDNLKRAERAARQVDNGLTSLVNMVAMIILVAVTGALAWKFDFESTMIGLGTLQGILLEGLPSSLVKFSSWLVFAITIAPTVIELFTAAYAKFDVKIIQIYVIAFTGFDLITDIPRAKGFTDQLQAHFDQLGVFSGLGYWIFFFFWLFLSTIGFELSLVIFAYLTVVYARKGVFNHVSVGGTPLNMNRGHNNNNKGGGGNQTVVTAGVVEDIKKVL